MGPPPRSLAVEANDCFMVRVQHGSNRIQGRGAMLRAQWAGSPRVVPKESLTYKSPYKELYAISVWPHAAFSQRATYPPSAAVRQRSIALITFNRGSYARCWPHAKQHRD